MPRAWSPAASRPSNGTACSLEGTALPVVGRSDLLKITLMTGKAIIGRAAEPPFLMAASTISFHMSARQPIIRRRVAECRRRPGVGGMACCAVVIDLWQGMVGLRRLFISWPVAGVTFLSSPGIAASCMTRSAVCRPMGASQREARQVMVVGGVVPPC